MPLAFKIDENLPQEAAALLREAGYDAVTVIDQGLEGGADDPLAEICRAEGRALVTLDLDFSDIRSYPPEEHSGIIVLRPPTQDAVAVLALIRAMLPVLETEQLTGSLWIVREHSLRIRSGVDE